MSFISRFLLYISYKLDLTLQEKRIIKVDNGSKVEEGTCNPKLS